METAVFKTIRAAVWRPSAVKLERLCWLYNNWGRKGYKMHLNMAARYPTMKVLNQWTFGLQENPDSTVARWWIRIPIKKGERRNYPLRMARQHEEILADQSVQVCNSVFLRKDGRFYIHLKIKKPVSQAFEPQSRVLAVDLGERNVATSVIVDTGLVRDPWFFARAIRGLRRHYGWLRRRLQESRHFRTLKRLWNTERRKVDDLLHKTAKEIVVAASKEKAPIAIGDLKHISPHGHRSSATRGKRFRRIVHSMPNRRLIAYIKYKAAWAGVPVLLVNEAYTSQNCHRCGTKGSRPNQGLFRCPSCGWTGNADINGAANIGKRALECISEAGAHGSEPEGGQLKFTRDRSIQIPEEPNKIIRPGSKEART
ncbi:MAG: RNA-guided endonuclease InsQ/TnpB family protein [Thermoplasmata archaeon]